jgi:hypothetical protein
MTVAVDNKIRLPRVPALLRVLSGNLFAYWFTPDISKPIRGGLVFVVVLLNNYKWLEYFKVSGPYSLAYAF